MFAIVLVGVINQRRGRRFIDDSFNPQSRQLTSLTRRLALMFVEVCRNGNHGALHIATEGARSDVA